MYLTEIKVMLSTHPWEYKSFQSKLLQDLAATEHELLVCIMKTIADHKVDEFLECVPKEYRTDFKNEFTYTGST